MDIIQNKTRVKRECFKKRFGYKNVKTCKMYKKVVLTKNAMMKVCLQGVKETLFCLISIKLVNVLNHGFETFMKNYLVWTKKSKKDVSGETGT